MKPKPKPKPKPHPFARKCRLCMIKFCIRYMKRHAWVGTNEYIALCNAYYAGFKAGRRSK